MKVALNTIKQTNKQLQQLNNIQYDRTWYNCLKVYDNSPQNVQMNKIGSRPYVHYTFEYDFHTHTPKLSNQNKYLFEKVP